MMKASNCSALIDYDSIPKYNYPRLKELYSLNCMPTGTTKNYLAYHKEISKVNGEELFVLFDPQTSGGLLISVDPKDKSKTETILKKYGPINCIGTVKDRNEILISLI